MEIVFGVAVLEFGTGWVFVIGVELAERLFQVNELLGDEFLEIVAQEPEHFIFAVESFHGFFEASEIRGY